MSLEAALAELKPRVDRETRVGPWLTIDQERIDRFARATGDFQWIHTDPERAKAESPYGATVAHGFLTLSLIPFLSGNVGREVPQFPGLSMAINYGLNKVRFPAAIPVGARIRARSTLMQVEKAKGGLQVIERVTIEIEGQERPGCVAECVTLLYF